MNSAIDLSTTISLQTQLPPNSLLLDRISLVWAGDHRRRGRKCVLSERHRRAVCRPVTLGWHIDQTPRASSITLPIAV